VKHGGVGVPEDGDELVSIDLSFDRAERRVAAFVCERGAHCVKETQGRGTGRAGREEDKGERIRKVCCGERRENFTLHETDITVYLRECEFPWTHGNG
jgi:hypothetical protein